MEHLINERVKSMEISGIRKFSNMVAGTKDIISLTIGQPDFPTPLHVKEAGKRSIDENFTSYTHNAGDIRLRNAASQFMKEKYDLSYQPESEIIVTIGASEAIDIAFRTILDEGPKLFYLDQSIQGMSPLSNFVGQNQFMSILETMNFVLLQRSLRHT